jgi:hypothetical protein
MTEETRELRGHDFMESASGIATTPLPELRASRPPRPLEGSITGSGQDG